MEICSVCTGTHSQDFVKCENFKGQWDGLCIKCYDLVKFGIDPNGPDHFAVMVKDSEEYLCGRGNSWEKMCEEEDSILRQKENSGESMFVKLNRGGF